MLPLPLSTAASEHYGSTIPALPNDGVLYHAESIDCNPDDYGEDPHFYIALGYIWDSDEQPMYGAIFYRNDYVAESGLTNPSVVFYGDGGDPAVFVRIGDSVERFEGFEEFLERYPDSLCSIPRDEI